VGVANCTGVPPTVKEQQKRIGSAEFRSTQFSYSMGEEGVEKFVATPELFSENSIGSDPLPPGQVWVISAGGADETQVVPNKHLRRSGWWGEDFEPAGPSALQRECPVR